MRHVVVVRLDETREPRPAPTFNSPIGDLYNPDIITRCQERREIENWIFERFSREAMLHQAHLGEQRSDSSEKVA